MTDTTYDVIIVGSGAGGGACLWALVQQNIKVLLLEAGPAYDYQQDYNLDQPNWEASGFPAKVPTEERQTYAEFQPLTAKWSELFSWNKPRGRMNSRSRRRAYAYHHVVGLGGSTLHYTGEAHRMNPASMRMRSRFGVAADWPVSYDELEPYYLQAEKLIGVAGPNNQNARWRSEPYPLPAHDLNYASHKVKAGCDQLGLGLESNPVAILSRPYDGRPGCNYCSNCGSGCPRADKGSTDVTFIRRAKQLPNCTIRTNANVIDIEQGDNDRIDAVRYIDEAGNEQKVRATVVVVACGAIETPRLLLNAGGLANESGQVGQNFMETLFCNSSGLHSESLGSHRGIPADAICWDFNAPDSIKDVIGGCRLYTAVGDTGMLGPINYAKRVVGGWGRAHKQRMREVFGRVMSVGSIGESLPNADTYIDLDPEARDVNGLAKARIHSYLDDMALQRLSFMRQQCREILKASGVDELVEEYGAYDYFSATHVFGTCRMGSDPEHSVVDAHGRSHRWKNLFIADASVFPSSGGGEAPSLTIHALAIRTADRIAELAKSNEL